MTDRRGKSNLFNPYIVLADVTIATIVIFVVMLIFSFAQGERNRRKIQDISERNDEIKTILNEGKWESGFSVAPAAGPTTLLIRIDGNLWAKDGSLSASGTQLAGSVIHAIEAKCEDFRNSNELIEIRVEGHCDPQWTDGDRDKALDLSLERAKAVRQIFKERSYVSVSGFGAERPAYRTTPAEIRSYLDETQFPSLRAALTALDKYQDGMEKPAPFTATEWQTLSGYLGREKHPITDRIDIVLVYHGVATDNNYVYPRVVAGPEPPAWVNDVSWPKTDEKFLRYPDEVAGQ